MVIATPLAVRSSVVRITATTGGCYSAGNARNRALSGKLKSDGFRGRYAAIPTINPVVAADTIVNANQDHHDVALVAVTTPLKSRCVGTRGGSVG